MLLTPEGLESLRSQLIVSCQAYPGEPMRDPRTTAQLAASAVIGGAAAVRVQGLADIQHTRAAVEVPVIGLWKDGHDGVFITPTLRPALAVANAGAHVVAIVMADCASFEDAAAAVEAGADLIGTTLAGYTGERPKTHGPDLALLDQIAPAGLGKPLIAEGRIHSPDQARQALDAGAFAVVVGTAITHPATISGWFAAALHS